jgi:hypothetical protein
VLEEVDEDEDDVGDESQLAHLPLAKRKPGPPRDPQPPSDTADDVDGGEEDESNEIEGCEGVVLAPDSAGEVDDDD